MLVTGTGRGQCLQNAASLAEINTTINVTIAVGDFNSDGRPDLVTASGNADSRNVTVLLNNGLATLGPPVDYAVGGVVVSIVVSDVNGDGKPDVVTAGKSSNTLSVLLNTGTGSFYPAVNYPIGEAPSSLTMGDINGDGSLDLLVTILTNNSILVFLNTGSGAFTTPALLSLPAGTFPRMVALGDFNSDNKADLVIANNSGAGTVSVRLGTGTGSFGEPADYVVGSLPYSVAVGDFNGDAKDDLVVGFQGEGNVAVLLNSGTGTFNSVAKYPVPTRDNALAIMIYDFNGDTKPDLLTKGFVTPNLSVLLNTGMGTFGQGAAFSGGSVLNTAFAIADFNEDGKPDLLFPRTGRIVVRLSCVVRISPTSPTPVCSGNPLSLTATAKTDSFFPSLSWSSSPAGFTGSGDSPTFTAPSVSTPTRYTVTVSTAGDPSQSASLTLTVNPSTALTSQPIAGSTVAAGRSVTVGVAASGTSTLTYQWYKDNLANPVAGQTSATLSLSSVALADVGSYSVVVTGACNSVTSSGFSLVVIPPDLTPILYTLPATQYGTSTFSVIVDVFELNAVPTQGLVKVHITKDPLVNLSFDGASTFVGSKLVQNSNWTFDSSSDENVYILTTRQVIGAGAKISFGLTGVLTPGNTKGGLTITAALDGSTGEEVKINNNTDADKIDYFKQ